MITEEDMLEYLGKKASGKDEYGKSFWKTEPTKSKFTIMREKVAEEDTREGYINFAKYLINIGKLEPLKYTNQLKDIPPLEELQGHSLARFNHPFWDFCTDKILSEFQPKSKIMVIVACANFKPYKNNKIYYHIKKRENQGYCDVFVNSVIPWPMKFSDWVYARTYDAAGDYEEGAEEAWNNNMLRHFKDYINKWHYEKVVLWTHEESSRRDGLKRLKEWLDEKGILWSDVIDETYHFVEERYGIGLAKTRHWQEPHARRYFDIEIGCPNPTPLQTEEEIKKRHQKHLEQSIKTRQKKKLQKGEIGFNFGNKSS